MTDRIAKSIADKLYGDDEASFADELRELIRLHDNLGERLQPYVDLYGEYIRNLPKEEQGPDYWSYRGPHSRCTYHINWEYSDDTAIHYAGIDLDNDFHSFELPLDFIANSKEKAEELQLMKVAKEAERRAAEKARSDQMAKQNRDRRRRQYEALKKEFGE